ncbi:MAG: zinc ribbon domain-containing protein [Candidatus Riflebacteria bacterium]|nr:zinc ribbon domain-containing protein [Candidatus Riflebacteria bacterium]
MKKWALILVLLFSVSPAWAIFCQYCGKSMADDAKFCQHCGKGVTAPLIAIGTPTVANNVADDGFFKEYEPITRYEMLLTSANSLPASAKIAESRFLVSQVLAKKEKQFPSFSPLKAKAHALFVRKNEILDRYHEALKCSINGPSKARGLAQKEVISFNLAKTNEMIAELKTGQDDPAVLTRVERLEQELREATREYLVTSPFLRVDNSKMSKGQPFWIAETKNGWAQIICLADVKDSYPVAGWVTLYDLSIRTTWKGEIPTVPVVVYHEPPVQSNVVIVEHDGWWGYQHHHHGWYGRGHRW